MRFQILTLLCYLSVLVLATGKLEDKSNIEDLENALVILVDDKEYVKASQLFTPNATYDPGPGPFGPLEGRPAIADFYRKSIHNITRFGELSTQLINFYPPFDNDGRSDRASAVSYNTLTFFGAGNSTDFFTVFVKVVDKPIVRTKEPGFDGWRIANRKLEFIVSFFFFFFSLSTNKFLCARVASTLKRFFFSRYVG